ncbi:PepSY-like domain-containing protein [Spirosoma luteum]|uniref:PepSY-like domain-containing protein n=1 Tax=Spirosoma luteum TaxID=431553 RepID=UPI000380E53D|nr:PepSY-like domain-containing protein [Spirosoma luteum]
MNKTLLGSALALMALANTVSIVAAHSVENTHTTVIRTNIVVPAAVKATVAKLYPGVKDVKWEKEDGNYEAGLTHNGKKLSLVIDAKGNVLETETTIMGSALPASVQEYVAKHYAGKKIKEAAEIVDAKGKKTYEAEIGGKDLIFDAKGQFIK